MQQHSTLVIVNSDGTHNVTQWTQAVDFNRVCQILATAVRNSSKNSMVVSATLFGGQQHMNYDAAQIAHFVRGLV